MGGSGYEYTKRAAEEEALKLLGYFTQKMTAGTRQAVVCGDVSDDYKTISTDDGRTLKCIVEGYPRTKRMCGIMMNADTVLITQGTRYTPTTDQKKSSPWILVGGTKIGESLGTNPSDFAIINTTNADKYFYLPFDSTLAINTVHANPAILHVNVNGPTGYGGFYYGAIKPDHKRIAIVRVVINNINSLNNFTAEPSPPYMNVYWNEFLNITLNGATGNIDYSGVNGGSLSFSFPTALVDPAYLIANVVPAGWSFNISGGTTEHTYFGLSPVMQWDNAGVFNFDLVGYSSSLYQGNFTSGVSNKQGQALVGATLVGANMQLGGTLTQLYNHLQYSWDGSFTATTAGFVHETYNFSTITSGPILQGGSNGWSPPLQPNLASGASAPLGIFGPLAFKNKTGGTSVMLTSQPANPFIHAQFATPYGNVSGGSIATTPKVGAVDTARIYLNNALWSDLSILGGSQAGLLKTVDDGKFSALRFTLTGGKNITTITNYKWDGAAIVKTDTPKTLSIFSPFGNFTARNQIMDWV